MPPAVAVRVAFCAVVTEAIVALKPMLEAPAGTVTEAGTVTAVFELDRLTARPPVPAAADRLTVQASVPAPVIEFWLQLRLLRTPGAARPMPLRVTEAELGEALSVRVMLPVVAPTAVGLKRTVREAV